MSKNYITVKRENSAILARKYFDLLYNLNAPAAFTKIERFTFESPVISINGEAGNQNIEYLKTGNDIVELLKYLENNPEIEINSLKVVFQNFQALSLISNDGANAKLVFGSASRHLDGDSRVRTLIYDEIKRNFTIVPENKALFEMADNQTRGIISAYNENIQHLQNISSEMIVFYSRERQKLETEFQEHRRNLENQISLKQSAIDNDNHAATDKITKQWDEFNAEKKKFDDSKNTHARRHLLGKIESILAERDSSNLTDETAKKFKSIEFTLSSFVVGIFVVSAFSIVSLFAYYFFRASFRLELLLMFSTTMIAGSLAFIWLVKLKQNWFNMHASSELTNRTFVMDMLRSSWIVEMLYEWKDEKGEKFDAILVDRLTQNLFKDTVSRSEINHPAEEAMKSIGNIKKIKINKDGVEMEK